MGCWRKTGLAVLAALLSGCGAQETLEPRNAAVPPGVNLSGQWRLREDLAEEQRLVNRAIRRTDGVDEKDILAPPEETSRTGSAPQRRNRGGLVHVFLETGKSLRITQTDAGLFLSFDRAVVEEFRFGENREVRVGPVVAHRVSGWEGETYVVETLDRNGMKLTERFSLADGGRTLRREIVLRSRRDRREVIEQTFERVD